MPIVIDASIALSWVLRDETDAKATAAIDSLRGDEGRVPAIWWFEVRNVLLMSERRGRLGDRAVAQSLHYLSRLPIVVDADPDSDAILAKARRHKLTVYDAAYLELAVRRGLPLATLDRALATAARAEAVPLIGSA